MYRCLMIVLSLGAAALLPMDAFAAGKIADAPSTCVTLSGQHTAVRAGAERMLIADGEEHISLDFGGYCEATMRSSSVVIATGGEENVVCTRGSVVTGRGASCAVREMRMIDAAEYRRHARRR